MPKKVKILICFLTLFLSTSFFVNFVQAENSNDFTCAVYFTYIGCPNCAYTDPIVLTDWIKKYPDLVVIEYMWKGGDWEDPNSQFFGEYAQKYKTQAAVPQLVISKNNIRLGRLDIPRAEEDIKTLVSNPCLLIDKAISWEKLNLNELKAYPKISANGRILIRQEENNWLLQWDGKALTKDIIGDKNIDNKLTKNLLFTNNISEALKGRKFEIVEPQKVEFSGIAFPGSGFVPYAEFANAIKINISEELISEQPIEEQLIEEQPTGEQPTEEEIELPIIGKIKTEEFSLPALTTLLAITDGLTNPCGFFVLFFLLSALLGLAGVRKRMLLVGGIFVFFFALYYFLFMAVLLNIFMMGRGIAILTIIAGAICILAGILNVKDYFFFQKGISLSLSKDKKIKFEERVRNLSLAKSTSALIIGTTIVASTISLIAIACTFGIPLAYTKILTSESLPSLQYYLYLIFYNLIYIIPMAIIVSIFAITLGKRTFGENWIRKLKLISGFIILFLGSVLLWNYTLLENIRFIFEVLIGALIVSGLIIFIDYFYKKLKNKKTI